jgi:hypothetical protein
VIVRSVRALRDLRRYTTPVIVNNQFVISSCCRMAPSSALQFAAEKGLPLDFRLLAMRRKTTHFKDTSWAARSSSDQYLYCTSVWRSAVWRPG